MKKLVVLAAVFGLLFATSLDIPCEDASPSLIQTAVRLINEHHHHGYKYRLSKMRSRCVPQKDVSSCEHQLDLELEETKCHVINPKHFDECEFREEEETKVKANCKATLTGTGGNVELLTLECNSEPASAEDLRAVCPDCPSLLTLTNRQGLDSINKALKKFNQESKDIDIFTLLEVGRLSTQEYYFYRPISTSCIPLSLKPKLSFAQYMILRQLYFAEFAIVETNCSKGEESEDCCQCSPLCDTKARHGFCTSIVLEDAEVTVNCEIYDAQNTTEDAHLQRLHASHLHHCSTTEKHPGPIFTPRFLLLDAPDQLSPRRKSPIHPRRFPACTDLVKMAATILNPFTFTPSARPPMKRPSS
ncbi:hypothetical protein GJAV_G00086280 [Gymnothorax javanicus]|nr:hypothetical protein GJAV_G00086280 [Gymnothorax javanicus]